MLRGTFKSFATYSLIAALAASPVMAATPGNASRQASPRSKSTRHADEPSAVPGVIRNALELRRPGQQDTIRQVVGKQPGSSSPDSPRGGSLLSNLFGGSGQSPQRSTAPSPPQSRTQSSGILSELFDNRTDSQPRAAQPAAGPPKPVDWKGIPYHQARSRSASQSPAPIRDPNPNETRISSQSRLADASKSARQDASSLPKPPSLAPKPTSRRTVPAQVVSSRLQKSDAAVLSPLSSSRRSGRRDVPTLDASEIAAAKAAEVTEEEMVPKIARRQINTDSDTKAPAAKTMTKPEAATNASAPDAVAKKQTGKPTQTPSAEVASTPAPQVAKSNRRIKLQTEQPAPDAVASDTSGKHIASTRSATQSEGNPSIAAAPSNVASGAEANERPINDDFRNTRTATAAPITAPAPAPVPLATTPSKSPLPQFATPKMPAPAAPQFGTTGTMAGHRGGPPASAFMPRSTAHAPLKPAGTPFGPAAAPVGSGIAVYPSKPIDRVAQTPHQHPNDPYAAPVPAQPSQPSFEATAETARPNVTSQRKGLGAPVQSVQPSTPQYQPYQAFDQSTPTYQSPQQPPRPTMTTPPLPAVDDNQLAAQPQTRAAAPSAQSVETAFSGTPFAAPAPESRPAMRPQDTHLSPEQTAVASELPGIRVVTHGPRSVVIRQTHEFEIRVENRGSIDAAGLMVRAVVPDWAEVKGQSASRGEVEVQQDDTSDRLVWTIDSLPAGSTERLFVRLQAVRSGRHGMDVDWTLLPQKSIATIEVREPKLDLIIEGPEEVVFGESQTYRVRVLNPGDGVAPNVVFTLSPNSSTPQTQRIGNIPSGKEAQFEVELTAQDLGDLKIHGLASGDLGLKAQAEKDIRVAAAELESVLAGPEMKYQNTDGVYLLQVTNKGAATSKNITAELALPPGVQYRGGIDSAQTQGTKLVWLIEALLPGATREYEFNCSMTAPGKQVFEFSATGTAAGKTAVALDTQVESIADLVMTIQDPAAPAPVGAEVIYEILIKNRGSRQASNIRAIAQFSQGIEPRRIEGHTGEVLTGQVLFDPIESIRPGQEVRIRVIAEAEQEGHHRFRTEIRSGETVLVAEEATQYLAKRGQRVSRRSSSSTAR